jgi:hypothetical protein
MCPKRYQVSTTISPFTWYQIQRLATEYGTQREVIARAVELLEAHTEAKHTPPDNLMSVDTRQDTSAAIGARLWARAGDLDPFAYYSADHAAKAAAIFLTAEGVEVLDWDEEPQDIERLIYAYLYDEFLDPD